MVKILTRALAKARKEMAQARKKARLNRLWMVVVKGENTLLVSPAYYLGHDKEADQCRRFESPQNAGLRLKASLFKGINAEVEYLGRYPLGASATYRHLYVCLVFVSDDAPLPPQLRGFTHPLESASQETRDKRRVIYQVVDDIKLRLSESPQNILRMLQE